MNLTHNSVSSYNNWRVSVESGAHADNEFWDEFPYMEYDKIIFVGDYVDSYDLSNVEILHNLKEIIWFKKNLPDKVILLIGNHDIQYFIPNEICSGYRAEMKPDLEDLFNSNIGLFKIAHQELDKDGKPWIWTHAGITEGWLKEVRTEVYNKFYRFYEFVKDIEENNIDELLNVLFDLRNGVLFNIDAHSGGFNLWAGPVWVRPQILNEFCLKGWNQIVGHTRQKDIKEVDLETHKIYYIDCLDSEGKGLILDL